MLRKEARSAEIVDLRHDRARLGGTARLGAGSASQGTVLWVGSLWDHRGPEARLWGEVGEREIVLFVELRIIAVCGLLPQCTRGNAPEARRPCPAFLAW